MSEYTFDAPRTCPECLTEFQPVVVVSCPSCTTLLWRPGFDESSRLFVFNPNADEGICAHEGSP